MKLTPTHSIRNLSPTKAKLKIGKAKSMIQKTELAQFSPRGLKSRQSLIQPQPTQVSEEVEYMGMFVEQLAMDPTLLLKLVDYQELVGALRVESNQIKQKILQGRTQIEILKKTIFDISGQTESSAINLLKQQQNKTASEIKKYLQLILVERTSRLQKNEDQKIRQKKLEEKIKICNENHKIKEQSILGQIKKNNSLKIEFNNKIKQLQYKNEQLKTKFQSNKVKEKNNLQIHSQVGAIKLALSNLKKKQSEELENYRNLMNRKKSTEIQLKKESEKKLSKFVGELSKVVQNLDRKSLGNLITKYEQKEEIRHKNISADTRPDENDEDQSTLQDLEQKNPLLKQYKSMNLKTLNEQQILTPLHIKDSNRLVEQADKKTVLLLDQKIRKINQQESDLDSFLDALKDKISKVNSQLVSQKGGKSLK